MSEYDKRKENENERTLLSSLRNENFYQLEKAVDENKVSKQFTERADVQELAVALVPTLIKGQRMDFARKFFPLFLPDFTPSMIVGVNPAVEDKFQVLQEKFPKLARKILASLDAIISIYPSLEQQDVVAVLERHPFLEQALINNEQYGTKLLFKFDSLDKLSQANIELLYRSKAEILAEQPEIDEFSPEFRVAMQKKLLDYRRNEEILLSMKKAKVNTEEWLSYSKEQYFDLGQETEVRFSEMIATPIKRIKTPLDKYRGVLEEVLEPYKKELVETRIPLKNIDELKQKLDKLVATKEAVEHEGNTEKATGLEIGIRNLEGEIAKVKTIPIWDKITKGMKLFDAAKNDVLKTHEALTKLEDDLKTGKDGTEAEKRKFAVATKLKIEKAKTKLNEQMNVLNERVENFEKGLAALLTPALGNDHTGALVQEINQRVAEDWDHYKSDKATIANLFSEKEGTDLAGQPMKVDLWNRNPDQDLYLGNYTDCCIRIDSDHMGAESTIADYNTDLGMQIIAIYDEQKNIPVVAAWCWVGVDNNDNVALVIDNIEADTKYTSAHQAQMTAELKNYITAFANQIGITRIVQGQTNNDLMVATMDSKYYKLGGYNRPSGYYLEGEDSGAGDFDDGDDDFHEPIEHDDNYNEPQDDDGGVGVDAGEDYVPPNEEQEEEAA